ncbi:hypothetical protein ABRD05_16535 [Bacillus velezensis]|uniref:hypothetical protein n=1 Tax=Bacillus TaxID=1386 RepID=UPI0015810535|nr:MULTISPECIES: hypothetical protein [Bacillus]MBT9285900.1 hypothetical protein [Bacillus velezensis]MCX2820252.1 hypothetical protein [Bacillus sp. H1F1]NUI59341.1 hypothetical protein [Bacillus amyloliquefaciens]
MSYIVNGAGAKVFSDINKNKKLDIPNLKDTSESGRVYTVLSVGFLDTHPLATIEDEKGNPIARLLPRDLTPWVLSTIDLKKRGVNLLPEKVEFGKIDGVSYAEMM